MGPYSLFSSRRPHRGLAPAAQSSSNTNPRLPRQKNDVSDRLSMGPYSLFSSRCPHPGACACGAKFFEHEPAAASAKERRLRPLDHGAVFSFFVPVSPPGACACGAKFFEHEPAAASAKDDVLDRLTMGPYSVVRRGGACRTSLPSPPAVFGSGGGIRTYDLSGMNRSL